MIVADTQDGKGVQFTLLAQFDLLLILAQTFGTELPLGKGYLPALRALCAQQDQTAVLLGAEQVFTNGNTFFHRCCLLLYLLDAKDQHPLACYKYSYLSDKAEPRTPEQMSFRT